MLGNTQVSIHFLTSNNNMFSSEQQTNLIGIIVPMENLCINKSLNTYNHVLCVDTRD